VELHTERTLRYFSRPIDLDAMFTRLLPLEIGGQSVRTFSVEDLLVMLCVHGAKHFWERLSWIVDIAQLTAAHDVDWALLMAIAEKMASTRFLLLGLYLAHTLFEAPLPPEVLNRAANDKQVQWLASKVLGQYSGHADPGAGVWSRAIFRMRSSDGVRQGLRQLFRLSLSPTESDRQKIKLPAVLSPLYILLRPIRLIGEYGLGLKRRPKLDLGIYEATPPEVVEQMLRFAAVSEGDVLYDLGCGDGRIVVAAAEKYGIRAVGVDISPKRIAEARANARKRGVQDRVEFRVADAKNTDVSEATVLMMYLETDGVFRMVERLRAQLRPGARIVSRTFKIYGWEPDRSETYDLSDGTRTTLYRWTITEGAGESPADEVPPAESPQTLRVQR
jgi:SAM-dependent methyltransferase